MARLVRLPCRLSPDRDLRVAVRDLCRAGDPLVVAVLQPRTLVFCQVKWPVRRTAPSLLVPNGSVASTTGRTFVIRVRGGRTEWVDVKTGLTSGPLVEVFGDLKPGDEIAARGTDELKAGASVHVKQAKPA